MKNIFQPPAIIIAATLLGGFATGTAWASEGEQKIIVVSSADATDAPAPPAPPAAPPVPGQKHVIIRTIASDGGASVGKPQTWLGVGVEDVSEPLAAQLDLKPGEGLVVNFVSTNGPAAAAGVQKNDVLVELDGQMLVDAAQLRKLVQMHAEGDSVKVVFFHAGKKQSGSAKLAKKAFDETAFDGEILPGNMGKMQFRLQNMGGMAGGDKGNLSVEIQRTMEQARAAIQDAMRQSLDGTDGVRHKLEMVQKKLGGFAEGGVSVGKNATVIVKNEGEAIRTMVKKDESGSYVIVADPAKRLTAHDADGKLLFDGAIDTSEQQQKVPTEVWQKVEPMLEQLNKDVSAHGKSSGQNGSQQN